MKTNIGFNAFAVDVNVDVNVDINPATEIGGTPNLIFDQHPRGPPRGKLWLGNIAMYNMEIHDMSNS